MTTTANPSRSVSTETTFDTHLVGSIPLGDAADVFRCCATILGDRAHRLPDGETGERANWIAWQRAVFDRPSGLEAIPSTTGWPGLSFRLIPGQAERVEFGRLGYADAAIKSWSVFQRLE